MSVRMKPNGTWTTQVRCRDYNGDSRHKIKRIRIHDLHYNHASFLIEIGFSAVVIVERLSHESLDVTFRYVHPFPDKQGEMAYAFDAIRSGI